MAVSIQLGIGEGELAAGGQPGAEHVVDPGEPIEVANRASPTVGGLTVAGYTNQLWMCVADLVARDAALAALAPVIGDIAGRGLLFLDDGSSARSRVMNFASSSAPVLKADLVLDGDTAPAAIDARLDQLVAIAEQRGYAIATATAFPSTVDRVAAFAKTAEDRGIALVPISAIVRPDGT